MEIFENAAEGDFGAIIILVVVGLILLRFALKILKFVIVQFPALFGGLVFGLGFADADGVDIERVLESPELWGQLIPYLLPALAGGFIIWNIILSTFKAFFRAIFGSPEASSDQENSGRQQVSTRQAERAPKEDDGKVTSSEISARQTRKRHMEDYEDRNKRIHQHDLSHRDKNLNQPIVQRRRRSGVTVKRRISVS